MIVKINILGLMSPKRKLIILKVCEIKTVHRLYCEAKLPYLNIYRMIILPVDEFMFLLVWALDADVCAINASNDTWNRSHGLNLFFWRFASACVGILVQSRTRSISASVTVVMVRHAVD